MEKEIFSSQNLKRITLAALVLVLLALLLWFVSSSKFPISADFRGNLWEPAWSLVHHSNPYDIQTRYEDLHPLWFPMIIGLFFPLGYLPLQAASNLWLALSAITLFGIAALIARDFRRSVWWIAAAVFALALFPPTVAHFKFGQVSLLVCLLMLLLATFRLKMKPILIGLLLSLCFTKPQIIVLFLPAFLISVFKERGAKDLLRVIAFTALWTAVLCIPLFIASPQWFSTFLGNLAGNPMWKYPSVYYQLYMALADKKLAVALAGVYLLMGVAVVVFLSVKRGGFEILLWSMALTSLFTPVLFSNDFVLIYPLLLYLVFKGRSRRSLWTILFGYGICMLLLIVLKNTGFDDDRFAVWVPLYMNGLLAAASLIRRRSGQKQQEQIA